MRFAMMSDTHYISRRMISDKTDKDLKIFDLIIESAFNMLIGDRYS